MNVRRLKIWLDGALSVFPIGYPIVLLVVTPDDPAALTSRFMVLNVAAVLVSCAILAYFIFYASRSPRVPVAKRARWRWLLLLGDAVTMPIFWFWYMRDGAMPAPAASTTRASADARLQAILDEHLSRRQP